MNHDPEIEGLESDHMTDYPTSETIIEATSSLSDFGVWLELELTRFGGHL